MRKLFLVLLTLLFVSSTVLAELKLKLPAEITGETKNSIINKNIEQNLKLNIPSEIVPPADMKDFTKGMILLGILADVSLPMGSDDGFKHVAGTGFSGHVVGSYLVSTSFLIALRAGYITFGTQTEEGSEAGYSYKYEDTYSKYQFYSVLIICSQPMVPLNHISVQQLEHFSRPTLLTGQKSMSLAESHLF